MFEDRILRKIFGPIMMSWWKVGYSYVQEGFVGSMFLSSFHAYQYFLSLNEVYSQPFNYTAHWARCCFRL